MSKRMLLACVIFCGASQLMVNAKPDVQTIAEVAPKATEGIKRNELFIDMQQAMLQSRQGAEAQKIVEAEEKKITEKAQAAQQEMVKTQQEMQRIRTEIEQKAPMMTTEAVRAQEKKYVSQENKLRGMQQEYQTDIKDWQYELQAAMQRETDAMIKDIKIAAKELAEKTDKEKVTDIQTGQMLYLRPDLNNTDQLISVMNEQHEAKKKAAAAAATTAPKA